MNKLTLVGQVLLKIISSLASGYLVFCATKEFYLDAPGVGPWLGKLSFLWGVAFLVFIVSCTILLAWLLVAIWSPEKAGYIGLNLARFRSRLGKLRWLIAATVAVAPALFLLYTEWGIPFTTTYFRLLTLLASSFVFALCISGERTKLVELSDFFLGLVVVASIFYIARLFTNVTNYPFSLSWSEGNRLYDYSIYADRGRYQFADELETPYNSPGRYLLWGMLFLIPGTPIWLHRLWDGLLWNLPYLLLGYLLSRWSRLGSKKKWLYALWIFLFLEQGPIYPPLLLSAVLIVIMVSSRQWTSSLIGSAIAGFYATASRWTWLPASPAWSTLILMAGFKIEPGTKLIKTLKGLAPIAFIALVSLAAGSLTNPSLYSPGKISSSMTFSQPLLWYRLMPNSTNTYGILWGLLIAVGPLVFMLIWLVASKRWPLNWLQKLAYVSACLVFLAVGLVASVKIGGGSNLHNLDMFLVTLAILSSLMLRETQIMSSQKWPNFARVVLVLLFWLPCWDAFRTGSPLELPPQQQINKALSSLQVKISRAKEHGEVLFIDQRHLITFGYVKDIPLISQYEKKYMMDQAMAGDAIYFSRLYQDLQNKRFALIITEPLFVKEQDTSRSFNEENNAWVNWVSRPMLCYYEPKGTIEEVKIQFLLPRSNPKNCP